MQDKIILDPCCGSKMFWFDKKHPNTVYGDKRTLTDTLCDGRTLSIQPDVEMDFTDMPFEDNAFHLVVFDPPHMTSLGANSWMAKKYGRLSDGWEQDISDGFCECLRVLKPNGVLIFKWNETDVKLSKVLELCPINPLFGHTSGRHGKTHWITYMKI